MRWETQMIESYRYRDSKIEVQYGLSYQYPNIIVKIISDDKKKEQDLRERLERLIEGGAG